MTRTIIKGLLAAAVTLSVSSFALAQAGPAQAPRDNARPGQRADRGNRPDRPNAGPFQQLTKELKLTDDQKSQIEQLTKDFMAKQHDAMQELRQDRQNDQGNRGNLRDEMQKVMTERRDAMNDLHQKISAILTPEQRQTWETLDFARAVDGRLRGLDLTEEQKGKVATIIQDAGKSLGSAAGQDDLDKARGNAVKKIVSDVLTDAQAGKLLAGGPGGPGGGPMMGMMNRPGMGGPDGNRANFRGNGPGNRGQQGAPGPQADANGDAPPPPGQ